MHLKAAGKNDPNKGTNIHTTTKEAEAKDLEAIEK